MKVFKSLLIFEVKRFVQKRNTLILLLVTTLSLLVLQYGINEYKDMLKRKESFKQVESARISKGLAHGEQSYKIRTLFLPTAFSIFFINSAVIPDITTEVDLGEDAGSGSRLMVNLPLTGRTLFKRSVGDYSDFSGIILFFAALGALVYGYDTCRSREYLKFLASLLSPRKILFLLLTVRYTLLFLALAVIVFSGMILAMANQIFLPIDKFLGAFFITIFINTLFFFLLGAITGTMVSKVSAFVTNAVCWVVLLFLVPTTVNLLVARRANTITPVYNEETEKVKTIMEYERLPVAYPVERLNGDYLMGQHIHQVRNLDLKPISRIKKTMSFYYDLCRLFPTTCYLAVSSELSSKGYLNILLLYNYAGSEAFSHTAGRINYGSRILPLNFKEAVALNVLYILMMTGLLYYRYGRYFNPGKGMDDEQKQQVTILPEVRLEYSKINSFHVEGTYFADLLFYLLSGPMDRWKHTNIKEKFFLDSTDMTTLSHMNINPPFIYLCRMEHIPGDIKVEHFIDLIEGLTVNYIGIPESDRKWLGAAKYKKFGKLNKMEIGKLSAVLPAVVNRKVVVLNDPARGISVETAIRLKARMEELAQNGKLVVFLNTDDILQFKGERKTDYYYSSDTWLRLVDDYNPKYRDTDH